MGRAILEKSERQLIVEGGLDHCFGYLLVQSGLLTQQQTEKDHDVLKSSGVFGSTSRNDDQQAPRAIRGIHAESTYHT